MLFLLPELTGVKAGAESKSIAEWFAERAGKGKLIAETNDAIKLLNEIPLYKSILQDYELGKVARAFKNILSVEEEAILRYYTTNPGYKNFNAALRGDIGMTEEFIAQKKLMNIALDKLPVSVNNNSDKLLYRIENLTDAQITEIYRIGETVINKGFTSSTYEYNSMREAALNRQFTVLIRIEGKRGRLIEKLSTLPIEKEILFKSGTEFYVKKICNTINPINPDDFTQYVKEITLIEK